MKIAFVGLGSIAPTHLTALTSIGLRPSAVCDVDSAKREAFAPDLEMARYADFGTMMRAERPDVVHILTPHYLHAPMIEYALAMGAHVLCEKPMALASAQALRVAEIAKKSSKQLGICFQNRTNPVNLALKEICDKEAVKTVKASVRWNRGADYYNSGAWRGKWKTEGGGVVINQAIHTLDLLLWMFGKPRAVSAQMQNRSLKNVIEVEDTVQAVLQYDGFQAEFFATVAHPVNESVTIEVQTEKGAYVAKDDALTDGKGTVLARNESLPFIGKSYWGVGHYNVIRSFYECIANDKPFPIDEQEGLRCMQTIDELYRASGFRSEGEKV